MSQFQSVIERLYDLQGYDQETAHVVADEILLECLGQLGHNDVVEAFKAARERIGFWYA